MASGKGKWHVKRGFQSKVSHGACHGSQDGTIGGWWCYCCHKTYNILWQLSNLSLGGIKLMTLGEMWSKLVPKTEDTYKEEYLKNSTTESIFIVLRWFCIINFCIFPDFVQLLRWLVDCLQEAKLRARKGTRRIASSCKSAHDCPLNRSLEMLQNSSKPYLQKSSFLYRMLYDLANNNCGGKCSIKIWQTKKRVNPTLAWHAGRT